MPWHLVETIIWASVAWYAIRTLAALVTQRMAALSGPVTPPEPVIPEDLLALALQHQESWAQEDVLRVVREKYDEYRDWNRVRFSMGIGVRNEAT